MWSVIQGVITVGGRAVDGRTVGGRTKLSY